MPTTSYLTVDGEILAETRGGADRDYLPDPLGSVAALLDAAQARTDTFAYWPYGEERIRTGTTPTPFRFVGALGYYRDDGSRTYVRARSYRPGLARWQTVDPLWPEESAYGYGMGNPTTWVDPSGLQWIQPIYKYWGPIPIPDPVATVKACAWQVHDALTPPNTPCMDNAMKDVSDVLKDLGGYEGEGHNNAVSHCAAACRIQSRCGQGASDVWQMRENPYNNALCVLFPRACQMDRHNNTVGHSYALKGMKSAEQCVDACRGSTRLDDGVDPSPITVWRRKGTRS